MADKVNNIKIEAVDNGKTLSIELTSKEVETAIGICESNGVKSLEIMKKHNGGAMFFIDPRNAAACMDRHNFEASFVVSLEDMKAEGKKKIAGSTGKENSDLEDAVKKAESLQSQLDLNKKTASEEITKLRTEIEETKKATSSAFDSKNTEITNLKNELEKAKKGGK